MNTQTAIAKEIEFNVGDVTTCQFGNWFDTNWSSSTHCNIAVKIEHKEFCSITQRTYYLITKVADPEHVGRASIARPSRIHGDKPIAGVLYCTDARTIGSKCKAWTGIRTFVQEARSLRFNSCAALRARV
jgi:hypothetical protein